jgi:Flp pilus assembly protein TadB
MLTREINNRDDQLDPRNHQGFQGESPRRKGSTGERSYSGKGLEAVVGIGVLALCAAVFYRVRELLAALILFSFLFGVVAIAVLILWLVERGAHEAAERIETHLAHIPAQRLFAPARADAKHIHKSPPWY